MPIPNNDISIFTNKNENGIKLSDRLNTVLTNSNYFDILVGYFRITGFYLLKEKLEDVKEIRILIGLGADLETVRTMDIFEQSGANATKKVQKLVKEEFNKTSDDNLEMENGVIKFCEWIKSGKLKIRMCYEKNVHAKLYIIRKNPDIVPDQFGNLITGSSNFTYNGLDKNVEFNVELKDQANVQYALSFFEELWLDSKDITEDILNTITTDTWMNRNITPYELFLKMLFVYFEEELDSRKKDYDWPDGYMNLQYQSDAVTQANSRIINWYYKTLSVQLGSNAVRMFSIYVKKIPIPQINMQERMEISDLVNKELSNKNMDDIIDNKIYQLFHLSDYEIEYINHI